MKENGTNEDADNKGTNRDYEDDEGEEIVIVRRSKWLQHANDMRDFIVEDYKEKRKSFKSRQEQPRQHRLAALFVLDEASVTFSSPSEYYGQFGDNDSSYVDHKDFDNNSKNNEIYDPDSDEEMTLGDEMLRSNTTKQIKLYL